MSSDLTKDSELFNPVTAPGRLSPLHIAIVAGIVLAALYLRVGAVLGTEVVAPLRADAADYLTYAYNLRFHGVYSRDRAGLQQSQTVRPVPDALRSPGYPALLTTIVGPDITPLTFTDIGLLQAVLGALIPLMVFLLARRFVPFWAAAAAASLAALSPHLINAGVYVLSETWFTFLLLGSLLALVYAADSERSRSLWLLSGLLLGAAALTRPGVQYFVVVIAVLLWLTLARDKRRLASVLVVVGFLMLVVPWSVRNMAELGHSSDPTLKINFLHHGMYPNFMYHDEPKSLGFPYRFDPRSGQVSHSVGSILSEIWRRFSTEPKRHLQWYLLGKPRVLWSWNIIQGQGDTFIYPVRTTPYSDSLPFQASHWLMYHLFGALIILAAIGSLLIWIPAVRHGLPAGARFAAAACSLLLLYHTALHMVGAPFPRYSIPMLPIAFTVAMFTLWQVGGTLSSLRRHKPGAPRLTAL